MLIFSRSVGLRLLYNYVYINQTTEFQGYIRYAIKLFGLYLI